MKLSRTIAIAVLLLGAAAAFASSAADKKLKMRIAVAPMDWSEHESFDNYDIPVELRNAIDEKLMKKLMDTGKFIVLEREAMQALLTEKEIKTENTGQSQKGKIVPAQALIRPKLTDFDLNTHGTGGGISIPGTLGNLGLGGSVSSGKVGVNVRIFDVDTSEMLADESATSTVTSHSFRLSGNINSVFGDIGTYDRSPLGEATTKALDQAVDKIVNDLSNQPWSASVADWDASAKEVTINAGSDLGVEVGDTFDIYRVTKVIKDPETGEVLGKKVSRTGSIKITSVEKKFAVGAAMEGSDFSVGDIVKEVR